jgi:hypothetical protein
MTQRSQDRQRRAPGRLWRSPFGKRRGRRHKELPQNAPRRDGTESATDRAAADEGAGKPAGKSSP